MSRQRPYVTALLFLLSILMLAVPVVPHHHHGDEVICMKNDFHAGCTEAAHHPGQHPGCCHDKGCLTTHFYQRTPRAERKTPEIKPVQLPAFFATCMQQLYVTDNDLQTSHSYSPYIESLHDTHIARATGLRAPPYILA